MILRMMEAVCICAILLILGSMFVHRNDTADEKLSWASFSAAHGCTVVERVVPSSETGLANGVGTGGNAVTGVFVTTSRGKTAYECDDGLRYWREDG
jgi:hypothetical protein